MPVRHFVGADIFVQMEDRTIMPGSRRMPGQGTAAGRASSSPPLAASGLVCFQMAQLRKLAEDSESSHLA